MHFTVFLTSSSRLLPFMISSSLFMSGCLSLPWSNEKAEPSPQAITTEQPIKKLTIPNKSLTAQSIRKHPNKTEKEIENPPLPANVWTRIVKGFALEQPNNSRVSQEYDWYVKHPEYLERVQKRARPFLSYILSQTEKRKMPTEMALLPIVESAFQPFAYSPGRASGLWQFIPSTGRMYGLKQDWWYDGRRDVIASSNAALDYLMALSKQFDGNWELALAAYNAGAGNVRKAIRKNKRRHKPLDFWSLDLPKETQTYVPRLLAISKIILDADQLNLKLLDIPNEIPFVIVKTGGQLDLAKAAEMAHLSLDEIYQLNPAYNRWATDPAGPHRLLIPKSAQQLFEKNLTLLTDQDRVQWKRYKIKAGDSLGLIAKKHHTTIQVVKNVNHLRSSKIRAGKHLLIPSASKKLTDYRLSSTQRLSSQQNKKRSGNRIDYIVQPGDNLWDIARAYKTTHRKIAIWNGIAPGDTLRPGQKLVIWTQKKQELPSFASASLPSNKVSQIHYKIRKGDSLSRIANKFNVSINDLKKWNRLPKRYLQPGQTLKLKVKITEQL